MRCHVSIRSWINIVKYCFSRADVQTILTPTNKLRPPGARNFIYSGIKLSLNVQETCYLRQRRRLLYFLKKKLNETQVQTHNSHVLEHQILSTSC